MKHTTLIIFFLLATISFGQQLKLVPQKIDNGYSYPHAVIPGEKDAQDKINAAIDSAIIEYKSSDYCIGQYGYVQKGSHIEIHLFASCMEMSESEHQYIMFNIETGDQVEHNDLFTDNQRKAALKYIKEQIDAYTIGDGNCTTAWTEIQNQEISYEDISLRMNRDGIEVRPANTKECESGSIMIPWAKLSSYLKYNFL